MKNNTQLNNFRLNFFDIICLNWALIKPRCLAFFSSLWICSLYSSSYLTCLHSSFVFHLITDCSFPSMICFSYTLLICFFMVSNFSYNFLPLFSFQLQIIHLHSIEGLSLFGFGTSSMNGYLDTQSNWKFLVISHSRLDFDFPFLFPFCVLSTTSSTHFSATSSGSVTSMLPMTLTSTLIDLFRLFWELNSIGTLDAALGFVSIISFRPFLEVSPSTIFFGASATTDNVPLSDGLPLLTLPKYDLTISALWWPPFYTFRTLDVRHLSRNTN